MFSKLSVICLFEISSDNSTNNFCQEFGQNNDKIQYSFRRDYKKADPTITKSFLVIKGKCWATVFKHDKSAEPTLTLDQQSKDCPIFTEDYPLGMCLNPKKFEEKSKYDCDAYLLNMDSAKGVFAQIPNDKHIEYNELIDYKAMSNLTIRVTSGGQESGKTFASVFQSDRTRTHGLLIFIRITDQKLSAKLFDFELKGTELVLKEGDPTKVSADYPVLKGSEIEIKELLVFVSQFNNYSEFKEKGNGWGFLLLDKKEDKKVFWCWTPVLKYNCTPQLLVDCNTAPGPDPGPTSGPAPGPDPSPGPGPNPGPDPSPGVTEPSVEGEEKGSLWLIILIIVVLVVIIAIIGCVVFFFMKSRSKEEPEAASAQVSASKAGAAPELSTRSQDVTSVAPSAVGSKAGGQSAESIAPTTRSTFEAGPSSTGQSAKAPTPKKA